MESKEDTATPLHEDAFETINPLSLSLQLDAAPMVPPGMGQPIVCSALPSSPAPDPSSDQYANWTPTDSSVPNPFETNHQMDLYEWFKVLIVGVTLFPIRFVLLLLTLLVALFICLLLGCCSGCRGAVGDGQPPSAAQWCALWPLRGCTRVLLWCFGFWWISVEDRTGGKFCSIMVLPLLCRCHCHSVFMTISVSLCLRLCFCVCACVSASLLLCLCLSVFSVCVSLLLSLGLCFCACVCLCFCVCVLLSVCPCEQFGRRSGRQRTRHPTGRCHLLLPRCSSLRRARRSCQDANLRRSHQGPWVGCMPLSTASLCATLPASLSTASLSNQGTSLRHLLSLD